MSPPETSAFAARHAVAVSRAYRRSGAAAWGVSEARFAQALVRSAWHRLGHGCDAVPATAAYLDSLHLEDLALATACLDGRDAAWQHFVSVYRPDLRQAARAIAGEAGTEIADGIFAELYGLDEGEPERKSLLRYFHGRSRLSTWLRTVLAQRHVDRIRAARRLDPLDETAADDRPLDADTSSDPPEPKRGRFVAAFRVALAHAVAALDPVQRQRLAWYHVHQLTLAEIGRLLREHEATVSRKLDRARRDLRQSVERELRDRHHFTDAEVSRCFELGLVPAEADVGGLLAGVSPPSQGRA